MIMHLKYFYYFNKKILIFYNGEFTHLWPLVEPFSIAYLNKCILNFQKQIKFLLLI